MAVQDVKLRLAPGETKEIQRPGQFIFCKFADREVSIIMDQARIVMEAGDKHVASERFSSFQVQNLDNKNEVYLIFVVGDGDFDRLIVRGEIGIVPLLRNQDGTTKADTRYQLDISLVPENFDTVAYQRGDIVTTQPEDTVPGGNESQRPYGGSQIIFPGPGGYPINAYCTAGFTLGGWYQTTFDLITSGKGSSNYYGAVGVPYNGAMTDNAWTPKQGFIAIFSNKLYFCGSNNDRTHIHTMPFTGQTLCYVPWLSAILIMDSAGNYELLNDSDLSYIRSGSGAYVLGGQGKVRTDWFDNRIYACKGSTTYTRLHENTLTPDGSSFGINSVSGALAGFVVNRGIVYSMPYLSQKVMNAAVMYDFVTKPTFAAVNPGCEFIPALTN